MKPPTPMTQAPMATNSSAHSMACACNSVASAREAVAGQVAYGFENMAVCGLCVLDATCSAHLR
eukprot:363424-Chlamydomonas_euryale.AAC.10